MSFVWIALYVLGGVVCVPLLARAMYDPDGGAIESSKEICVGGSIVNAVVWPVWAVIGLLCLVSKHLAPLIFESTKGEQ